MSYCANCKVLLQPSLTVCPYCDSHELMDSPPDPQQGNWISLPDIPGIADGKEVGAALKKEDIQYYIDQSGDGTNIKVGDKRYVQAKKIQEDVLGG